MSSFENSKKFQKDNDLFSKLENHNDLQLLKSALNALDNSSIVSMTDAKGKIVYCNEEFCKISKYSQEEMIGKDHRILRSGIHDDDFFIEIWKTLHAGKIWQGEICNRAKDGEQFWVNTKIVPIINQKSEATNYLAIRYDITEKKQQDKILELLEEIHSKYVIQKIEPAQLFDDILKSVLTALDAEYGFIGRIITNDDGARYMKTFAMTNIAWNEETRLLFEKNAKTGFEFKKMNSLYGWSIENAKPLISNSPAEDKRSHGLPPGHPHLNSYMGVPLFAGLEFVGMIGIANRKGGFSQNLYNMYSNVWNTLGALVSDAVARSLKKESQQSLKSLVSSMNDIVFEIDEDLRYINAWASNEEAFFIPKDQFIGKKVSEVFSSEYAKPLVEAVQYVFKTGRPFTVEYQSPDKSETWYSAKVTKSTFKNSDKNSVNVVVTDITALKNTEVERDLQKAKAIQASKMATLGEMAGGIAHEINNPLAIIDGSSAVLERLISQPELDRSQIKNFVEKIRKTTARIASIIKGLRSFARDSESDPFVATPVRQIIEDTLGFCEARLRSRGIGLKLNLSNENLTCECRSVQISQVLLNLINNATDAIQDHLEKWLEIETSRNKDFIYISVTDSGRGISRELAEKIMQPFYTTKPIGQGTGLGLSIARGIAEAHGGILEIDHQHTNTRFVLKLPIKHTQEQQVAA